MSEAGPTPNTKSVPIRPSMDEIKKHAEILYDAFLNGRDGETPTTERIGSMFALTPETCTTLTAEELADVKNFGKYATTRLAAGAITSPINHDRMLRGETQDALGVIAPVGPVNHDVLHAMWAWRRTNGRSLVPAYARVKDRESQFTDPTATQEELIVGLFDSNEFVRDLFSSKNPTETSLRHYSERRGGSASAEEKNKLTNAIEKAEALKEKDPMQHFLSVYEAYTAALDGEGVPAYADSIKTVQANRSPEYVRIFTTIYENSKSANPDPKLMLHEFQRILAPLLTRLRNNAPHDVRKAA